MIFVGVDPSIRATGIVALRDGEVVFQICVNEPPRKKYDPKKPPRVDAERLANMERAISNRFDELDPSRSGEAVVAVEEPFVGKSGPAALKTYSIFAAVVVDLQKRVWSRRVAKLYTPSPATVKKFVGAKEKNFVARRVFKLWGYEPDDDNLVDAYAIARWAEAEWNGTTK